MTLLIMEYGGIDLYRLLIVTKDPKVENVFASIEGWEAMGYKPPRIRHSAEDAIECMHKHHIDAIAMDDDAEFASVDAFLDEKYPSIPIFQVEENAEKQLAVLAELYQLLTQMHADHSNDDYGEEYYFNLARERWMKKLISGLVSSRENVLAHHRLFRCRESVEAPCVYARLSVPSGDAFLSGRWHYGSERLEIGLRNFFGSDHEKMTVHVAVFSPEEVRVLACPKESDGDMSFGAAQVLSFIEETIDQIEHYLGLKMNVIDICKLEDMTAFAGGQG